MRVAALLVVAATGLAPDSFAAVYTCTDAQGRTIFQDLPCGAARRPAASQAGGQPRSSTAARTTEQALERSQVEAVLKKLHQAMTRRDAKAVIALLAKDAEVQWVFGKGKPRAPALDREAYGDYLRNVFEAPDYVYQRKSERLTLSKSKPRATVTRVLREAVLVDGRLQIADVDERLTIERDGRRLVLSSIRKTVQQKAAAGPGRPSARSIEAGKLASVLLAKNDQDDEHDDSYGHRDVEH
jgi:hypothetical protein